MGNLSGAGNFLDLGLAVGVLSGVSSTKDLIPHADVLIESVDELHAYVEALAEHEAHLIQNGFNTDFAFEI